jgi:hypothetical protein
MKVYIDFKNNLFNDVLPFIDCTNNFLEANRYLTWNDVVPPQRKNIELAKEYGIKSFVYNHGLYGHEDHCGWIKDNYTSIHKVTMDADKYLCWGQRDFDDLQKAGIPKDKLSIVGFSGLWDSVFDYKLPDGRIYRTSFNSGSEIIDPKTKEKGVLVGRDHKIRKQHSNPKWITYVPSHDVVDWHLTHTTENFKILKDVEDLIIKASSAYVGLDDKNIFKDVLNYTYCGKCDKLAECVDDKPGKCSCGAEMPIMPKVTYTSTSAPDNLAKFRSLISESKVVITDYVGTPNLLCHAIGVPVITIKNDYGMRVKNGDEWAITHHDCPADILVEPKDLLDVIKDVCSGKINKQKEMAEMAEIFGGVSKGWPTENILKELEA